jgi:hypothetical protein
VARNTKAPTDSAITYSDAAQDLISLLLTTKTSGDLWKIGSSDEFKTAIATLANDDAAAVRESFVAYDVMLKGKVKITDVADIPLTIPARSWDFPNPSPQFPDSRFVVIKGVRDDTGEKFELVSSAMQVYRYFTNANLGESQHIMFVAETTEEMVARNAQPGTSPMWIVKRLAPRTNNKGRKSPF